MIIKASSGVPGATISDYDFYVPPYEWLDVSMGGKVEVVNISGRFVQETDNAYQTVSSGDWAIFGWPMAERGAPHMHVLHGEPEAATEDATPSDATSGKWSFSEDHAPVWFCNRDTADTAYIRINTTTAATNATNGFDIALPKLQQIDLSFGGLVAVRSCTARWYTTAGGDPGAAPDAWSVRGWKTVQ
jgi:hypothetical protein